MPCRSALFRTISPHWVSLGWCVLWVLRCGCTVESVVCVRSVSSQSKVYTMAELCSKLLLAYPQHETALLWEDDSVDAWARWEKMWLCVCVCD